MFDVHNRHIHRMTMEMPFYLFFGKRPHEVSRLRKIADYENLVPVHKQPQRLLEMSELYEQIAGRIRRRADEQCERSLMGSTVWMPNPGDHVLVRGRQSVIQNANAYVYSKVGYIRSVAAQNARVVYFDGGFSGDVALEDGSCSVPLQHMKPASRLLAAGVLT